MPIKKNQIHQKIVEVTLEAGRVKRQFLDAHADSRRGQVVAAKEIRNFLHDCGLFDQMDGLIKIILPKYVSSIRLNRN